MRRRLLVITPPHFQAQWFDCLPIALTPFTHKLKCTCKLDSGDRAVLENCTRRNVPLQPKDQGNAQQWQALSRSARALISTASPWSLSWVTGKQRLLTQSLVRDILLPNVENSGAVLSFTVLNRPESPQWPLVGPTRSLLRAPVSEEMMATLLLMKARHMTLMAKSQFQEGCIFVWSLILVLLPANKSTLCNAFFRNFIGGNLDISASRTSVLSADWLHLICI